MKSCTNCGQEKEETEFYSKGSNRPGLRSECKKCINAKDFQWRKNNSERKKALGRKWYEDNKEEKLRYTKEYRENNKDRRRETGKIWRKTNSEKVKINWKRYKENNRDKLNLQARLRRQADPEKFRQQDRKYRENNKEGICKARKKYYLNNSDRSTLYSNNKAFIVSIVMKPLILKRDNYQCQLCFKTTKLIMHHILPKNLATDLIEEPKNLVILCSDCHLQKAHKGHYKNLDVEIAKKLINIVKKRANSDA